jgi:hypothetical protein
MRLKIKLNIRKLFNGTLPYSLKILISNEYRNNEKVSKAKVAFMNIKLIESDIYISVARKNPIGNKIPTKKIITALIKGINKIPYLDRLRIK